MNKKCLLLAAILCLVLAMTVAMASAETATNAPYGAIDRATQAEADVVNAANAPRVITMENGIRIQRTPYDNTSVYGRVVPSWNNLYMNADNRGCLNCHSMEQALSMLGTFHGSVVVGYEAEYTLATCYGCHGFNHELRDKIHALHNFSSAFNAMNGTCESCHYIDDDGKYLQWDFVKYDVLRGITDIAAENVKADFSWNQTTITPTSKMFYKNNKSEPDQWLFFDEQVTEDIYDKWTITVDGDVDNPFEMTIREMIDTFGTVTQSMKANCVINGIGDPMVFQVEVTGIPASAIVEYAGAHEDANMFYPIGEDGYCYNFYTQEAIDLRGIIVLKVNGETLPAGQGFPAVFYADNMAAGNFTKRLNQITIAHSDGPSWALYGWVTDPTTGEYYDKPNMGVLNAPSGIIYEQGQPIHLEGWADAWDEPITRVEFSFDHGSTWIEKTIEDASTLSLVFWDLDLPADLDAGSYYMQMHAFSQKADGTERSMYWDASFMFNVQ